MSALAHSRPERDRFWSTVLFWGKAVLGLAALAAIGAAYPSLPQCAYCQLVVPFQGSATGLTHLLACSNVRQAVVGLENAVEDQADAPGWRILHPQDPDRPAEVLVKLKKDRDRVLFYPRMSGGDSFVEVWEAGSARRLAAITGQASWNPVGEQHTMTLTCVEHGHTQDFDVTLRFVLMGRWAQLWMKDGNIVF